MNNIKIVNIVVDNSGGQVVPVKVSTMYIEPTKDLQEIEFWKKRLDHTKMPYILADVEYTALNKAGEHMYSRGKAFFVGKPKHSRALEKLILKVARSGESVFDKVSDELKKFIKSFGTGSELAEYTGADYRDNPEYQENARRLLNFVKNHRRQ